jgi:lipid-binding SYLF domain-containing protein
MMKWLSLSLFVFLIAGCASMGSGTKAQKQQKILSMRQEVLKEVSIKNPEARDVINASKGYGVFSNANINIIFLAGGTGFGVVRDNRSGKDTFMNMAEAGLGLGLGAKDYRLVLVFHTDKALDQFLQYGWNIAGNADVAAKASDKGGSLQAEMYGGGVSVYTLTESGLAAQATIKGTKFWADSHLN